MTKNPYVGMPIEIIERQQPRCKNCVVSRPGANNSCGTGDSCGAGDHWNDNSGFDSMYLGSLPIAMCYVPNQRWKTTYPLDQALEVGTLFPELDLPFIGGMKR